MSKNVLVPKRPDGTLAIAVWNLLDPDQKGAAKTVSFHFANLSIGSSISMRRVDADYSNALAAYKALGSPESPTEEDVEQMNRVTQLEAPQALRLEGDRLTLHLAVNALAVLEVSGKL